MGQTNKLNKLKHNKMKTLEKFELKEINGGHKGLSYRIGQEVRGTISDIADAFADAWKAFGCGLSGGLVCD